MLLFFDKGFIDSVSSYETKCSVFGRAKIDISKEFFCFFCSELFKNIAIRDQKRIIDLVQTCHKITVFEAESNNGALNRFEYQHLIWEILVCAVACIMGNFGKEGWFRHVASPLDPKQLWLKKFDFGYDYEKNGNSKLSVIFNDNLCRIFRGFMYADADGCSSNISLFKKDIPAEHLIYDNYSFLLSYYAVFYFGNMLMDAEGMWQKMLIDKIISEQPFLKEFQRNVFLLVAQRL